MTFHGPDDFGHIPDPTEVFPAQHYPTYPALRRLVDGSGSQHPVYLSRREPLTFGQTVAAVSIGVFFGLALTSLATIIIITVLITAGAK